MVGNRKRGRGAQETETSDVGDASEGYSARHPIVVHDPPASQTTPLPEHQLARLHLRQRWELASVLHFLRVFRSIIGEGLDVTAEEIETALISPNHVLAELHIALLKGIPPVSKNVVNSDAWVTMVCKKIKMWWQWVAEGDIPLIVDHGKEILRYKELDPTIRLLILKALCEIRSGQYDVSRYVNDELRRGTELSAFRKDKMGGDGNGIAFWYDGDSVFGHRLYRESGYAELKQQLRESFHLMEPKFNFKWETLATNLEEFRDILDKLSSSSIPFETAVGKTLTNEIIPILEKLQKMKERALKRKQRHAKGMQDSLMHYQLCGERKLRIRGAVCYTFDEFDHSIDEAIELSNEAKMTEYPNNEGKQCEHAADVKATASDGRMPIVDNDDAGVSDDDYDVKNGVGKGTAWDGRMLGVGNSDAGVSDDDCNVKNDEEAKGRGSDIQNDGSSSDSNQENSNLSQKTPWKNAKKKKYLQPQKILLLRRSMRTASRCHKSSSDRNVKKTLGQWHDHDINSDNAIIVPDSEDDDDPPLKGKMMCP